MKRAYLTIDDGPSADTPKLLRHLAEKGITAVFFCTGANIEARMGVVVRAIKEGHIIGNHSYSHVPFSKMGFEEIRESVLRTEKLIDEAYLRAGVKRPAKYFRFPYEDFGKDAQKNFRFLRESGFTVPRLKTGVRDFDGQKSHWLWTVDTKDWMLPLGKGMGTTMPEVKARLGALRDNGVILVHDHPKSSRNIAEICAQVSKMGFEFAKPESRKWWQKALLSH